MKLGGGIEGVAAILLAVQAGIVIRSIVEGSGISQLFRGSKRPPRPENGMLGPANGWQLEHEQTLGCVWGF